jgi:5-(carboxyamino)imidazole ribonucleotide mutase
MTGGPALKGKSHHMARSRTSSTARNRAAGDRPRALVGIIMGSQSDWETMRHAAETLAALGVPHEAKIVSAHRTPHRLYEYATEARTRGLKAVIAGAGGAAHLPGMAASLTPLPVFGVPVESRTLKGLDSLLSIAQMPAGIPVGTLAIGRAGAVNAALLAAAVLALNDAKIAASLDAWRRRQTDGVALRPTAAPAAAARKRRR